MSTELLEKLLKFCPRLKYLGLRADDFNNHNDSLNTVFQHCQNLSLLFYSNAFDFPELQWRESMKENHGLREVYINVVEAGCDNSLELFFRRHHNTLEHLELNTNATEPAHRCLEALASLDAPHLEIVFFSDETGRTATKANTLYRAVESLVQVTPLLRTMRLDQIHLKQRDQAFTRLGQLKHLEMIHLFACKQLPKSGLYLLFTESQSLRNLEFIDPRADKACITSLMDARKTKQPQNVVIASSALHEEVVISAFADGWKESTIERLELRSCEWIKWQMLELFPTLPRLKTLIISALYNLSMNDIHKYLHQRSNPAQVVIGRCHGPRTDPPCGRYIRDEHGHISFTPSLRL